MDKEELNALITGKINELIAKTSKFDLSELSDTEAINSDNGTEYLQELQCLIEKCNEKCKEFENALIELLNALNKIPK